MPAKKVEPAQGIFAKLLSIQNELKAPKSQRNDFGKYNYRNCEDILEALKPLCATHKAVVIITDHVEEVASRVYIRAVVKLQDTESDASVEVQASARETLDKKGMDAAQITGAASSYARKYALNGLFSIDDTKDADSAPPPPPAKKQTLEAKVAADRILINAITEINLSDAMADLKTVFAKHQKLQGNPAFKAAATSRRLILEKK